ncbi:DUF4189 domain-containing protein [Sebaldella sp. S0638]|uniref:DUF4189 domain-containing protein n=1 Tax=Sebaldella sp. S0638 TaxID=2957809 RepID=UPI00209F4405|nr:DUF4189 domain-containing protein [Sebaldella sp. S0638]MCP1226673.1 DUF4189 domain-containing protein [Sebaldella sp. S0638]
MKKFLLFITMLFTLSFIGSANTCNSQYCTCPNGTWVTYGQYCTVPNVEVEIKYYGAIAVNIETEKWSSAYNYPSSSSAKKKVLSTCGENCKVNIVSAGRCGAVAYSESTKTLEFDSAIGGFAGAGYNTREERAKEKALKKCSKKSGDCKILTSVCNAGGI